MARRRKRKRRRKNPGGRQVKSVLKTLTSKSFLKDAAVGGVGAAGSVFLGGQLYGFLPAGVQGAGTQADLVKLGSVAAAGGILAVASDALFKKQRWGGKLLLGTGIGLASLLAQRFLIPRVAELTTRARAALPAGEPGEGEEGYMGTGVDGYVGTGVGDYVGAGMMGFPTPPVRMPVFDFYAGA